MIKYLTTAEIADLKAIRATYVVNADLIELTDFFKKFGMYFSTDKNTNIERVYKMIFDNFDSSRNLNGITDAKILKVYTIAKTMDLTACIKAVSDKVFLYLHDSTFDSTNFVLDNNFDFSLYLVGSNDPSQVAKTNAINVAMGTTRV